MCITCCSLVIQCNEVPISISCPDCPENGFRCDKSKLCIDSFSVCDGKNDCDDGSDERNCGNTVWENEKFTLTEKKISSNRLFKIVSLVKTLLSRNFCQK